MRQPSRQPSRRPEQVAGTIRQVVAEALARDIRDPRVGFVTVTGVLVTNDLSHARVTVSVPGDEAERTRALQGLQSAAGFLRSRVARALTTRIVPELHFELDRGVEHAARIDELLDGIRREEHGLIGAVLVDKPAGLTSHDVVQRVRRALGTRPVGHTGTLDPFATGLLVVLVGRATRLARFVEAQAKTYLATARLGVRTDTDDLTGARARGAAGRAGEPGRRCGRRWPGSRGSSGSGRPATRPSTSAASAATGWRGGAGRWSSPETTVTVHRIELVAWSRRRSIFRATVSAGTYLRAIARDLGERLGVGAPSHRAAARGDRRRCGWRRRCRSTRSDPGAAAAAHAVLGHLPAVELDEPATAAVVHGVPSRTAARRWSRGDVALAARGRAGGRGAGRGGWLRPSVRAGGAADRVLPAAPAREHGDGRARSTACTWAPGGAARDRRGGRDAAGRASVLVTFEPHPLEVVNPQAAPPLLTTGPERREILAQTPLDYVLLPPLRPPGGGLEPRGVRPGRPARALRDAGAGDRARSRIRAGAERRRGDAAAARRHPRLRRGRGRRRWISATSTSPARGSGGPWPAAISRAPPGCWAGRIP